MGSIILAWRGRCEHSRQEQLLEFIDGLARQNAQYWTAFPSPLNAFSRMLHDQRSAGQPELDTTRFVDFEVRGRILVGGDVVGADAIPGLEQQGIAFHRDPQRPQTGYFVLDRAPLKGIDFRLFDPFGRYPGSDRLSFVFLRLPGYPVLDGRLVHYHSAEACRTGQDREVAKADAYLESPFIHLRYNHEAWLDSLMVWLKHFFIHDLSYQSNRVDLDCDSLDVPGYVAMEESCGRSLALKLSFKELSDEFNRECLEAAGQSRSIDL